MTTPQDHIERLLAEFRQKFPSAPPAVKKRGRPRKLAQQGVRIERSYSYRPQAFETFLSSSLHSLADAQKQKALEVVREISRQYEGTRDPGAALSAVEEAFKKEL